MIRAEITGPEKRELDPRSKVRFYRSDDGVVVMVDVRDGKNFILVDSHGHSEVTGNHYPAWDATRNPSIPRPLNRQAWTELPPGTKVTLTVE